MEYIYKAILLQNLFINYTITILFKIDTNYNINYNFALKQVQHGNS